ncbi:MAG TPA: spore coat protein [Symbiobacteriaceae bacterium]
MPQTNANPLDIAIATLIDKDLKSCASASALSACECSSPELRQAFVQVSQDAVRTQERLSHLMQTKGWYVPPRAEQSTISTLMPQLQAATQGLGGTFAQTAATAGFTTGANVPTGGVTAPHMV